MNSIIKKLVKAPFDLAGLELVRKQPKQEDLYNIKLYKKLYPGYLFDENNFTIKNHFFNVGSGTFYHPCWSNLDYVSDWYKGVQQNVIHIDLMEKGPLPIKSESAEIVYTSHTIEHIKDDAVENLFHEVFKSLKAGGCFRVTTGPDAETDFAAMMSKDEEWFYWDDYYKEKGQYEHVYKNPAASVPLEERWLHHVASQLAPNDISPSKVKLDAVAIRKLIDQYPKMEDLLDYLTSLCEFQPERAGNHVSWWSHKKIMDLMTKAGFRKVYRSGYGQSRFAVLRDTKFFDNTHPQMSIYVEGVKS